MIATYQNESLKVIFAALLGEIYFTLVEMLAVVGVNGLEGKTDLLLIYDRLQPMDLLIPVLFGTGIVLLKLFGGRWLARYRDVRIRRRQLFWFAIVAYFIVAQTNGMIVIGQEAGLVTATGMPFIGIAVLSQTGAWRESVSGYAVSAFTDPLRVHPDADAADGNVPEAGR